MSNLSGKSDIGTIWSMVERVGKMGIQLACTLVIAQFLPPSEFGLVSMMSIFLAFSTILIDGGFSQALIHEQHVTEEDESSIFWFNILLGVLIYAVFFLTAPLIAGFYDQPYLAILIRVAFLALILQSVIVVQQGLLFKSVDFKVVSKISLWAVILSGIAGIIVSYVRRDVWGLIVQNLSFALFQTLFFWFYSSWRPRCFFSWYSVRKYLRFALNLLGSNMLAAITDNLGNLVVGKAFNSTVLGNYTMANKIPYLTAGTVSYGIKRVSYSIMSTFQDDDARLSHYSQRVLGMAFWVVAPIMVFLFVEADAFVAFLFPPEWAEAAVYLRYFSIWGFVFCFSDMNQDLFLVKGRTDILFRIDIARRAILIAVLVIGAMNSIILLLQLLIAYYILNSIAVSYIAGKLIHCPLWKQMKYQTNTLLCMALCTIAYIPVGGLLADARPMVIAKGLLYYFLFLVASSCLRNPYFCHIRDYLKAFINKRKQKT